MIAQPIEPRPPAFETAAARSTVPNPAIGACTMGCSISNSSTTRRSFHITHLLPATSGSAAVDMHDLACDKGSSLQIYHGIDDLLYFAHAAHRLQACEEAVRLRRMHRSFDRTRRDGVDADVPGRVLDRERAGDRVEPALGEGRERRRQRGHRLLGDRSSYVHDVTRA